MNQQQWIKITNNFPSRCIQCDDYIDVGQTAMWLKGLGIKHEECQTQIKPDESTLIILEQDDQERLGLQWR